jgi:hypothetical protein
LVSLPLLNRVIVHWGWHWAFGVLGFAGLAWTAAWLALGREGPIAGTGAPSAGPAAAGPRIPYSRLLLNPTIIASWCASFGAYWGLSQALTWQGAFMIKGLGFTQGEIGLLSALPSGVSVIVLLAGGWLSQRLLAGGIGSRWARGVFGGTGVMLGGTALLLLPYMPNAGLEVAMTTIGIALPTVIYIIWPSIVGEITLVAQRGAVLAIGTAIGTLAGLMAPYVTGSVVENAGTPLAGFHLGYSICGAIMLFGGTIGALLMHPERELERLGGVAPTVQYRRA